LAAGTGAAGLTFIGALNTAAHAVPPSNDTIENATVITGIPATFTQDTREATESATDPACVGSKSIWYRYTPTTTSTERVATVGSSYRAGLAVFTGRQRALEEVACHSDRVGKGHAIEVRFVAGQKYWIAVGQEGRRGGDGGTAVVRLYHGAPAGADVTIDAAESGGVSGRLTISGTIRCDTPSAAFVSINARQRVGQAVARGEGGRRIQSCDDKARKWVVRVESFTGWAFQPGTPVALDAGWGVWDGFEVARGRQSGNFDVIDDPDGRPHR
jgi:hypothetical protein